MKNLPHRAHWYEFSTGWSFKCFFIRWPNLNQLSHRAQWHDVLLGSLFKWFQEIKTLPHKSQCYEFSTVWIFLCIFMWFLQMNFLKHRAKTNLLSQHDSSCASVYSSKRWYTYHTEPTDMNSSQDDASCVSSYGRWIWIHCHTEHNVMKYYWDHSSSGSWRLWPCHTNHSGTISS